jgi:hypothetical protein
VGYDPIPEALEYFQQLEIPVSVLNSVTVLSQDGGDPIYMNICPFWSGENDAFNIHFFEEDVRLLPNLKRVSLFYDDSGPAILASFRNLGIEADWL